jgi:hypothetical protein
MTAAPNGKLTRIARLAVAFTPAAPVNETDMFAGRDDQIGRCIGAIFQRGLHIVVYGERGVGKTSLANVLPSIIVGAKLPQLVAVRVDCYRDGDFEDIWRKVFAELATPWSEGEGRLDPENIRIRLQALNKIALIVIDELDRLRDKNDLTRFADTVKTLSDHAVGATLMLVGVADSVDQLIGNHESIVRCLTQISLPRMQPHELERILDHGFAFAGLSADASIKQALVVMAEGLPHFVHVLGLEAGSVACEDDRDQVKQIDLDKGIRRAVKGHSIMSEYRKATESPQPGHLYEHVLLACALVPKDQFGYFRPRDVVKPLSSILGKPTTIPAFARHLNELSGDSRGNVLLKEGRSHNFRYRFRNPFLQPFAKMVGLSNGLTTQEVIASFPVT